MTGLAAVPVLLMPFAVRVQAFLEAWERVRLASEAFDYGSIPQVRAVLRTPTTSPVVVFGCDCGADISTFPAPGVIAVPDERYNVHSLSTMINSTR